jgi:cytochrome c oxidase subunit 2
MAVFAKALADEQAILDVVAHIGTLKSAHPARTELDGDPERGSKLYSEEILCSQCHGSTGQGLKQPYGKGSDAPRLAGQHDWYLIRQLQNFKAGVRGDPKDKFAMEMRVKAKIEISGDRDIKDLAAYLSNIE